MKFFLCVIGMVMIIEGMPYFALPDQMKSMMLQIFQLKSAVLRRIGLALMLLGLLLVYIGRS